MSAMAIWQWSATLPDIVPTETTSHEMDQAFLLQLVAYGILARHRDRAAFDHGALRLLRSRVAGAALMGKIAIISLWAAMMLANLSMLALASIRFLRIMDGRQGLDYIVVIILALNVVMSWKLFFNELEQQT
jgi:hypothetical protein